MYLSRIVLDTSRKETMHALNSLQLLHRAIEFSFPGERKRTLWRIDWSKSNCYLLILSPERADFSHIVNQYGYPNSEWQWETKSYQPLLSRIESDQIWQFRLCANPVRSSLKDKEEGLNRGRIHAHVTMHQQKQWLINKAEACGFQLDEDDFDVVNTQWVKFYKGQADNHKVTFRIATFEGKLKVIDADRFKNTLTSGIGRAKAYGCGLMTIAQPRCDGI